MLFPFSRPGSKYRPDIDGLRAIAIISVVAYHAGFPGVPGGFVGVDVFFVISGYLITALLFDEAMVSRRLALGAFYARRVRRLMPAGVAMVLGTLLLGALFLPPASDEQRSLAKSAQAVAYFGSNFYFFKKTGGYFDDPSFSIPLLHTWSLAVEEQYYLVWPLLMVLVFRFSHAGREREVMRRRVLWTLGGLFVVSLAASAWLTPNHQNFAFYLLPARVWEFAIGGMVGLAGAGFFARLRAGADAVAVAGLAMILYGVTMFNHGTSFPGWIAIVPVFGTAALIAGMTASETGWVRRVLSSRPFVVIGLLSYSWYLWHWPLLSVYRIHNLGEQDVLANAGLVTLALFLAWLTYLWIEHPIREHRPGPFARVKSTLYVGGGISLATVLGAACLLGWNTHQKSSDLFQTVAAARTDVPPYQTACSIAHSRDLRELPGKECVHGPDKEHPRVLLWGDSHADHLMSMVMAGFPEVGVYQLTMAGCVPAIGYEAGVPAPPRHCADFNRLVMEKITALKKQGLEAVVISARWPSYLWHPSISLSEQVPGAVQADAARMARARSEMKASFDATLSQLARIGVRVLVLEPTPELVYAAPQCVSLGGGSRCNVPRAMNESLLGEANKALQEVVSRHENARLAHLMDFFCDTKTCYALRDGKILYLDDDHVTASTGREIARYLAADLAWLKVGAPGRP